MTRDQITTLINNHNGIFIVRLDGDEFSGIIEVGRKELLDCISDSDDGAFYAEIFDNYLQLWGYSDYQEYQKAERS